MTTYGQPTLILWDIDHTLVSVSGVSRDIYDQAFRTVVGRPLGPLASMAGRTDHDIIAETFRLNEVNEPELLLDDFYTALGEAARARESLMREIGRSLPGAHAALHAFDSDSDVQSVVTGNIRAIAETKLAAFGLTEPLDLSVGGYGDDSDNRADLVRLARSRTEAKYRQEFAPHRVVVIGDTPRDIRGARDAGVRSVGVATGATGVDELRAAGADAVLAGLSDPEAVRAAVYGRTLVAES